MSICQWGIDQVVGWVGYFHLHPSSSLTEMHALQAAMCILCIKALACMNQVCTEYHTWNEGKYLGVSPTMLHGQKKIRKFNGKSWMA